VELRESLEEAGGFCRLDFAAGGGGGGGAVRALKSFSVTILGSVAN
jgi:hypothetical protein